MNILDKIIRNVGRNLESKVSREISHAINTGIDAGIDGIKNVVKDKVESKNNSSKNNEDLHESYNEDLNLGNMQNYMQEVPKDLEDRAKDLEEVWNGEQNLDDFKNNLGNLMSLAKDSRNLTMGNMSVLTQAMANTTREASPMAAGKLDELANGMKDISSGKLDK